MSIEQLLHPPLAALGTRGLHLQRDEFPARVAELLQPIGEHEPGPVVRGPLEHRGEERLDVAHDNKRARKSGCTARPKKPQTPMNTPKAATSFGRSC